MRLSMLPPRSAAKWCAQFRAEQPNGRAREYLIWLSLRWDEFVQACVRMGIEELLETDLRHRVFAWWMTTGTNALDEEIAQ